MQVTVAHENTVLYHPKVVRITIETYGEQVAFRHIFGCSILQACPHREKTEQLSRQLGASLDAQGMTR